MSDDDPWAIDCLARWRPRASWRSTVEPAAAAIDGAGAGAAHGWASLAMMFGDTGATGSR